jgi:hypothetical protein
LRSASLLLGLAFALGACGHFGADADNEINVYPTNYKSDILSTMRA